MIWNPIFVTNQWHKSWLRVKTIPITLWANRELVQSRHFRCKLYFLTWLQSLLLLNFLRNQKFLCLEITIWISCLFYNFFWCFYSLRFNKSGQKSLRQTKPLAIISHHYKKYLRIIFWKHILANTGLGSILNTSNENLKSTRN